MAKRKGSLSTVVDFMSDETQAELRERAGVLSPLDLNSILPDPNQPRQLLPADLAQQVQTGELTPTKAVVSWQKRGRSKGADATLRRDIEELERLANSIAQHGLINPISVRRVPGRANLPDGVKYLIITGERRYWAHALLAAAEREIQEGLESSDPHTIKATIAPEGISVRAHQIVENVMREDIDAVEKAQGFLALRYELSGIDVETGEGVNHGSPPSESELVSWEQVQEALNISKRYRQYITAILNLDPRAQAIIRRHRLSERTIRPISQRLGKQPELQLEALNQIVAWQEAGPPEEQAVTKAVDSLVESMLAKEERRKAKPEVAILSRQERQVAKLQNKIGATLGFLEQLGEDGRAQLAEELRAKEGYEETLDELQRLQVAIGEILKS